eukprot:3009296-Pyramimonas_sp.AAC.1
MPQASSSSAAPLSLAQKLNKQYSLVVIRNGCGDEFNDDTCQSTARRRRHLAESEQPSPGKEQCQYCRG